MGRGAECGPEGGVVTAGRCAGAAYLGIVAGLQGVEPGCDSDFGIRPSVAFLADLPFGAKSDEPEAHAFCAFALMALGWFLFRSAAPRDSGAR